MMNIRVQQVCGDVGVIEGRDRNTSLWIRFDGFSDKSGALGVPVIPCHLMPRHFRLAQRHAQHGFCLRSWMPHPGSCGVRRLLPGQVMWA